jgi:arginyl-tRNA synthetase
VREADERVKAFRTYLVRATVQTMSNVLRVLGFVPLEEISFSWVTPQILLSTA